MPFVRYVSCVIVGAAITELGPRRMSDRADPLIQPRCAAPVRPPSADSPRNHRRAHSRPRLRRVRWRDRERRRVPAFFPAELDTARAPYPARERSWLFVEGPPPPVIARRCETLLVPVRPQRYG